MTEHRPDRIGRYEIINRLALGKTGILYLARDPLLGRPVTIKVLSVVNPDHLGLFAREARSVAGLTHPHIVSVYDVGEEGGQPFLAMEYVDGETLTDIIRRRASLSVARKLELVLQLCGGLGHAHRAGIIHRDIKPGNLMVTGDGQLKVLDFGLARMVPDASGSGLTLAGTIRGTPNYMSPEQIEGRAVDHRSDIFSVGLVFYELLTYLKAFPGDLPHTVLHRIVHTQPRPVAELCEGLDPRIERVVARAIEKSPDRRYQQLAEMVTDLTPIAKDLKKAAAQEGPRAPEAAASTHVTFTDASAAPSRVSQLSGEAIARRREEIVAAHLAQAADQLLAGRIDEAATSCEAALVLDPEDPRALRVFQQVHRALEEREEERERQIQSERLARQDEERARSETQRRRDAERAMALAESDTQKRGIAGQPRPTRTREVWAVAAALIVLGVGAGVWFLPRTIFERGGERSLVPPAAAPSGDSRTSTALSPEAVFDRPSTSRSEDPLTTASLPIPPIPPLAGGPSATAAGSASGPPAMPAPLPNPPKPEQSPRPPDVATTAVGDARTSEPREPTPPDVAVSPLPAAPPQVEVRPEYDERAIEGLLNEYKAAYEGLDAAAVARMVPLDSQQVRTLDLRFQQLASFQMTLEHEPPNVEPGRTRATVACFVTTKQTLKSGGVVPGARSRRVFEFEKAAGVWRILRVS